MYLLVCDYDNTLNPHYDDLYNEGKIDDKFNTAANSFESNIKTINRYIETGNLLLISTGRHYEGIVEELESNNIHYTYLSCNNGTELYDPSGNILYCNQMDKNDIIFIRQLESEFNGKINIKFRSVKDGDGEKYVSVSIKIYDEKIFESVRKILEENIHNSACYFGYPKIRIENKNVNKIDTIEIVKNLNDINEYNIYTIGDDINDLYMVSRYKGYTLKWGINEIKKRAISKYDSVSKFVDDVFLSNIPDFSGKYKLKNNIEFDITNSEYQKVCNAINKYKTWYSDEFNKLIERENRQLQVFNFDDEIELVEVQTKLIQDLFIKVLNEFEILNNQNICTFFTGSVARGTLKTNSDFDFHFAYDCDSSMYTKYEELFYYVIFQITGIPREKIHPMIFTAISDEEIDYINKNMDRKEMIISFKVDGDTKIQYKINGRYKKRMYFQLEGDKSLKSLSSYLQKWSLDNFPHEWLNNFSIVSGADKFDEMYVYIYNQQEKNSKYNLMEKINNFIIDLECFTNQFQKKTLVYIRDIKNYYQFGEFKRVFNFCSLIRQLSISQCEYIKFNNLINLFETSTFKITYYKEVAIKIYKYLWNIKKLIYELNQNGISYSLHSNDLIPSNITIDFDSLDNEVISLNKEISEILKKLLLVKK